MISFGGLYGLYFELSDQTRNEPLYLSLFIISTVLFVLFLAVIIHDAITNRDLKLESNSNSERMEEMHEIDGRMPVGSDEYPQELIGKDKKYYNNSFEKGGNLWRTSLFFLIAIFIFTSFMITYAGHSKAKKDSIAYIVAVSIAAVGMAAYIGLLGYQTREFFNIDRTESIPSIKKISKTEITKLNQ